MNLREMERAHDYAEGYANGQQWAREDRANHFPPHDEIARLHEETKTEQRWARAYYLGALRGYREVVRTLRDGRWGT